MGHLSRQRIVKFNKHINVISNNMEIYMAFIISDLVFIDSFLLMNRNLSDRGYNSPKWSFFHTVDQFGSDALE